MPETLVWGCWWETEIVSSSSNVLECGFWQTALGDFWKQTYGCFGLVVVAWLLSHVQLFVTPWSATCQTSLITVSQSLLQLMSIESVMLSNHLILCHLLLLLPSIFVTIKVFPSSSKGLECGFWQTVLGASGNRHIDAWGSCGHCEATLQLLSYLNASVIVRQLCNCCPVWMLRSLWSNSAIAVLSECLKHWQCFWPSLSQWVWEPSVFFIKFFPTWNT